MQIMLKTRGIPTVVYYPKPMHRQTAFEGNRIYVPCPVTDQLCDTVLSLPMHPYLDQETVQAVAAALGDALAWNRWPRAASGEPPSPPGEGGFRGETKACRRKFRRLEGNRG